MPTSPVWVGLEDRSRRVVEDGFRGIKFDDRAGLQKRESRRKRVVVVVVFSLL